MALVVSPETLRELDGQPGAVFSSQTMFRLPGGGWRSPDAAWIRRERWNALSRSGVRLGWLLDPEETQTARIHRPDAPAEERPLARGLSGDDVLPGFVFHWERPRSGRSA
jgi:Uma2 family endonuclease